MPRGTPSGPGVLARPSDMLVYAKTEIGVLQLDIDASASVGELKALIERSGGPAAGAAQIIFSGRSIKEGTLADNGIQKEATLVIHSFALERTAAEWTAELAEATATSDSRVGSSYKAPSYTATEYKATSYKATDYKASEYKATEYKATEYKATEYKAPNYTVEKSS